MRRNNFKKNIFFIVILLFIILGISVSYALLQSDLSVNYGTTTQDALAFDVSFYNVEGNTKVKYDALDNYSSSCAEGTNGIVFSEDSITYNAKMLPDSRCRYKFKIRNKGTTEVLLKNVTSLYPYGAGCSSNTTGQITCIYDGKVRVKYSIYTDSDLTTLITNNNISLGITSSTRNIDLYLVVEVTDVNVGSDFHFSIDGVGFKFTFGLK